MAHPFTVTKFFRGNPRLLLQAVPVAVLMIVLKWLYDLSPLRHLDFSPLLTGVIAASTPARWGVAAWHRRSISRTSPRA